jgi:hypothetical protein
VKGKSMERSLKLPPVPSLSSNATVLETNHLAFVIHY